MYFTHICDRLSDEQYIGIAVGRTRHGNMHAGIAYRWAGNLYLYHQAFHFDTRLEDFAGALTELGGATLVVRVSVPRDRQKAIAGLFNDIGKINPKFPYSLRLDPGSRVDETLGRLITKDGIGLSCVTFVLAMFQSAKIQLVDSSTWPIGRSADLDAQQSLVRLLEGRASAEHVQAVREEVGCTRVRPEEIAATACYLAWPVSFPCAEAPSLHLLWQIAKLVDLPSWSLYPEAQ